MHSKDQSNNLMQVSGGLCTGHPKSLSKDPKTLNRDNEPKHLENSCIELFFLATPQVSLFLTYCIVIYGFSSI